MAIAYPEFGRDLIIAKTPGHISGINNLVRKIVRRFKSATGCLYWDPQYGLDLRQFLNNSITKSGLTQIKNAVKAQCELDERVKNADVTVTSTPNNELIVTILITTQAGPTFSLIISVSQLTVNLLNSNIPNT